MSAEQRDKPFEATQSRLQKARREGDVARSGEVNAALAFGAALCATMAAAPAIGGLARAMMIGHPDDRRAALILAWSLLPALGAAVAASAGTLVQGGLRVRAIDLKFERLNPLEGIKRICSREAAIAAVRASAAVACIIGAGVPLAAGVLGASAGARGAAALGALVWREALGCGFALAALGLLFGGTDFALAVARWKKRLRMSFDELKREHKDQDGDPAAKGRRRSLHREFASASMERIKDAAFVVVNPTHVAVALEYAPPAVPVPRVLLRGADETALRLRRAAAEHRIPVIENVPLARALYANGKAGEVIPKAAYVAVAEIVATLAKAGLIE